MVTLQPAFLYNRCYSDYGYATRPLLFHRLRCGCHSVCLTTRRRAPRHSSAFVLRSQRHRPRQRIGPPPLLMAQRRERPMSEVYFDPKRVGSYGGVDALRRVTRTPRRSSQNGCRHRTPTPYTNQRDVISRDAASSWVVYISSGRPIS